MLMNLNYSRLSESWENCLGSEMFHRALYTIIYGGMENVNTKPYVLGITAKFSYMMFFQYVDHSKLLIF